MKIALLAALLTALLSPVVAKAILPCEGSLTKDSFVDERKQIQTALQKSIYDYRKLESSAADSPGAKDEMAKVKADIDAQKVKFQEFDSKYFPTTPVTAFGAACNDKRWLEEAKAKLVEKPENLGKHWYVWLDKTTRKPTASIEKPSFSVMAE